MKAARLWRARESALLDRQPLEEGRAGTAGRHAYLLRRREPQGDRRFFHAAIKAGAKDNGKPGLRPHYHPDYYGAFVLDPDGNKIEACSHHPE